MIVPNPSSSTIKLAGELSYPLHFMLSTTDGKVVKSDILLNSSDRIDISYLEANVYFLQLGTQTFKVIKK